MFPASDRISPELTRLLAERGDVKRFKRGHVLIREGDIGSSIFILLNGQLTVFTKDARGREVIYNHLERGEVLGEMFLDGGPRSASVRATTDVECLEVGAADIRSFMRAYPEFSESMVLNLIERLRRATVQIRSLALDDVFARTVAQIESLIVVVDGVRYLPASVTQQGIANRIGATREMVNHVFRELVREGHLVRHTRRGFVVPASLPRH